METKNNIPMTPVEQMLTPLTTTPISKENKLIEQVALDVVKANEEGSRAQRLHPRPTEEDEARPTEAPSEVRELKRPRTAFEREEAPRKPETLFRRISVWQTEGIDSVKKPNEAQQKQVAEARDTVGFINRKYQEMTYGRNPGESTETIQMRHCTADITHIRGGRPTQEDGHLVGETSATYDGLHIPFFAICDGHGGTGTRDFLLARLPLLMNQILQQRFPEGVLPQEPSIRAQALDEAFLQVSIMAEKELSIKKNHLTQTLTLAQESANTILSPQTAASTPLPQEQKKQVIEIQKKFSLLPQDRISTIRKAVLKLINEGVTALSSEKMREFIEHCNTISDMQYWGGSTLTMAAIIGPEVWTINVGDSRTIATDRTGIHQLSQDASLEVEKFAKGVIKRGGEITQKLGARKRVSQIEPARSFEGRRLPAISARAKITCYPIPEGETTLVLGCDGLFDVLSSREVGTLAPKLSATPSQQLARAAYIRESTDNISVMVVKVR